MTISEIPAKLIERAEALTETKLQVAATLTTIAYSTARQELTEEKILKTYFNFYQKIKDITPPPLEQLSAKKVNIYLVGGSIAIALILGTIFFGVLVNIKSYLGW